MKKIQQPLPGDDIFSLDIFRSEAIEAGLITLQYPKVADGSRRFLLDLNKGGFITEGTPENMLRLLEMAAKRETLEFSGQHCCILNLNATRDHLVQPTRRDGVVIWARLNLHSSSVVVTMRDWLKESGYPFLWKK